MTGIRKDIAHAIFVGSGSSKEVTSIRAIIGAMESMRADKTTSNIAEIPTKGLTDSAPITGRIIT